jgi:hypothetical protein
MIRKKLPIGIQTFAKLREDECYYWAAAKVLTGSSGYPMVELTSGIPRYQKYLFDLKVEFSNDRWSLGSLNLSKLLRQPTSGSFALHVAITIHHPDAEAAGE